MICDRRLLASLALVVAVLVAGCGADDEEEDTATEPATTTAAVQPTAPPAPTQPAKKKKKKGAAAPAPATPAPAGCVKDPRFAGLKFSGISCAQAYALAAQWDEMANDCNTIDDPESPEGFKRTCDVAGYTCTAKRVTTSEARKVACTSGSASVRFSWTP
jgi:hypothetical protein